MEVTKEAGEALNYSSLWTESSTIGLQQQQQTGNVAAAATATAALLKTTEESLLFNGTVSTVDTTPTVMAGGVLGVNATVLINDDQLLTIVNITKAAINTIGICCIVVNISFLVVMQFTKEGTTPFHKFMKNLSLTDILASLAFILTQNWPEGPFSFIYPSDNFWSSALLPYIFRGMPWMFFTSYFLTLTCLSINQYVAVCKPWKYSRLASSKMIVGGICAVWIFSTFQIVVPSLVLLILGCVTDREVAHQKLYMISKIEMQIWMGVFLLTTFISIVLNSLIYQKIRELKWKRRLSMTSQESLNIRMKQEAFLTITLLLVSAVLLRMPFPIVSIIILEMESNSLGQKASIIINSVLLLLLFINFFTDTVIYTIRVKEARRMYKTWCTNVWCCCGINRSSVWSFRPIPQQSSFRGNVCSKITDRIELSSCRSSIAENGVKIAEEPRAMSKNSTTNEQTNVKRNSVVSL